MTKITLEREIETDKTQIVVYNEDGMLISSIWLKDGDDGHRLFEVTYELIRRFVK